MKTPLRTRWVAATPRERTVAAVAAAIVAAVLYLWLVQSASDARGKLTTVVTALRTDAARLELHAAEMERLRTLPGTTPAASSDLRTLVQNQAGAAGLSPALLGINVADAHQVQVVFGTVRFADWLAWVESLQKQQVRLETCRIEALSAAGLVSVTATFSHARPR